MKSFVYSVFLCWLCSHTIFAQVHQGDVALASQADVDNFVANNYTRIEGKLSIGNTTDGSDITDLSGLNSIQEIVNPDDEALHLIRLDQYATNLDILNGLKLVEGNILIVNLQSISSLSGFDQLSSVRGRLAITQSPSLVSIDGLNELDSVYQNISITQNNNLETIAGFQGMTSHYVADDIAYSHELEILQNPKLTSLNGFRYLETAQVITVALCDALESLDGLCSITNLLDAGSVTGGLVVFGNPNLSDCYAAGHLPTFTNGQNVTGGMGDCTDPFTLQNAYNDDPSLDDCEILLSTDNHETIAREFIYPNPFSSAIQINEPLTGDIKIMDFLGRVIHETKKNEHDAIELNLESLLPGKYIIFLKGEDKTYHSLITKI